MTRALLAGAGGVVMALGLGLAGLTDPRRIVGFLDFTGAWDPTALVVLAAAVLVYGAAFRLVHHKGLLAAGSLATQPRPDARLVVGAALFGVGWGASGLCPGPAIASVAGGAPPLLVFAGGMVAGMAAFGWSSRPRSSPAHAQVNGCG